MFRRSPADAYGEDSEVVRVTPLLHWGGAGEPTVGVLRLARGVAEPRGPGGRRVAEDQESEPKAARARWGSQRGRLFL